MSWSKTLRPGKCERERASAAGMPTTSETATAWMPTGRLVASDFEISWSPPSCRYQSSVKPVKSAEDETGLALNEYATMTMMGR